MLLGASDFSLLAQKQQSDNKDKTTSIKNDKAQILEQEDGLRDKDIENIRTRLHQGKMPDSFANSSAPQEFTINGIKFTLTTEGKIGSGSYGAIYSYNMFIEEKQKTVAVKITKCSLNQDINCLLIQKEIEACKLLYNTGCENLCQVLYAEYFKCTNKILVGVIIMKKYQFSLNDLIPMSKSKLFHQQYQWNEKNVLRLFVETIGALYVLHQKNIIHRDIKPANIFMDYDGKIVIADFGLVQNKSEIKYMKIAGTTAYMTRKIYQGTDCENVDEYALAVSLYEVLIGADYCNQEDKDICNTLMRNRLMSIFSKSNDLGVSLYKLWVEMINENNRPSTAFLMKSIKQLGDYYNIGYIDQYYLCANCPDIDQNLQGDNDPQNAIYQVLQSKLSGQDITYNSNLFEKVEIKTNQQSKIFYVPKAFEINKTIFERMVQIGAGVYGVVFSYTTQGTEVAVKISKYTYGKQMPESDILSHIKHKNICKILYIGIINGDKNNTTYDVMTIMPKYKKLCIEISDRSIQGLKSNTIKRISDQSNQNIKIDSFEQVLNYFKQMADAVEILHMRGIMHRDINLENIMHDGKDNIKICGFSYATNNTRDMAVGGTPGYIAPEITTQKPGSEGYDKQVDIYSLGVTWYTILAGWFPLANNSTDTFRSTVTKRILLKFKLATLASDKFRCELFANIMGELLSRMLIKDPKDRPNIEDVQLYLEYIKCIINNNMAQTNFIKSPTTGLIIRAKNNKIAGARNDTTSHGLKYIQEIAYRGVTDLENVQIYNMQHWIQQIKPHVKTIKLAIEKIINNLLEVHKKLNLELGSIKYFQAINISNICIMYENGNFFNAIIPGFCVYEESDVWSMLSGSKFYEVLECIFSTMYPNKNIENDMKLIKQKIYNNSLYESLPNDLSEQLNNIIHIIDKQDVNEEEKIQHRGSRGSHLVDLDIQQNIMIDDIVQNKPILTTSNMIENKKLYVTSMIQGYMGKIKSNLTNPLKPGMKIEYNGLKMAINECIDTLKNLYPHIFQEYGSNVWDNLKFQDTNVIKTRSMLEKISDKFSKGLNTEQLKSLTDKLLTIAYKNDPILQDATGYMINCLGWMLNIILEVQQSFTDGYDWKHNKIQRIDHIKGLITQLGLHDDKTNDMLKKCIKSKKDLLFVALVLEIVAMKYIMQACLDSPSYYASK